MVRQNEKNEEMITDRELYWEREFKLSQFERWQKENLLPPLKGCQQVPQCLIPITDVDRIVWPGAFVHSFKDDYKFDGRNGVWHQTQAYCTKFLMKKFGALTPDFSTPLNLHEIFCRYNLLRSRMVGWEMESWGIPVISTLIWWSEDSLEFCLTGLPTESVCAVSTVCIMRSNEDKRMFQKCLLKACDILRPSTLLVYGSTRGLDFCGQRIKVFPNGTYDWTHLENK